MKKGFIFDVDGVIAETPHENAWRESLQLLFETKEHWKCFAPHTDYRPERFTTTLYRERVSGKPRIEGARAALAYFGVPDPEGRRAEEYSVVKQLLFLNKIQRGEFKVYDDALLILLEAKRRGIKVVAASSSKNANRILGRILVWRFARAHGEVPAFINENTTVLDLLDGNVCGIDVGRGKPDPEIFLQAAASVGLPPGDCLVVEDAVSGVQAARAGNFYCVGVARLGNEEELKLARADVVTTDLTTITTLLFERP